MKKQYLTLIISFFLLYCIGLSDEIVLSDSNDVKAQIATIFNLKENPLTSEQIKQIIVIDANSLALPFVHQMLAKKELWQVQIDSLILAKESIGRQRYLYDQGFTLLLDPVTGNPILISSKYKGIDPNMLPEPPNAIAEERMLKSSSEQYHGFPETPPQITFYDALKIIETKGMGSPYIAKEIHAVYVMHSYLEKEPIPAWVVTLRGIPPIPPPSRNPDVPVWQRNRMRYIIDVMTGEIMLAKTSPLPVGFQKSS